MPSALLVEDLTMRYQGTLAVDRLRLSVESGTITAVLGPNGAGKTTTLETAAGFRSAQQGRVRTLGLDPVGQRHALLPRIGVMPQTGGAWSGIRAHEMLRHVASLYAHPHDVDMLIDRFGLGTCGRTTYRHLSGGQQRRLGLAMALVGRPELLFVDEPTAGMDPQARHATWTVFEELRRDGVTVVLTTHLIDEAERLADQVYVIDHGSVIAAGSPADLVAGAPGRARTSPPEQDERTGRRPAPDDPASDIEVLSVRTSPPLPAATMTAALTAADCAGVAVSAADANSLRLIGAITPAVITAVAACCQDHDTRIEQLDRGSPAEDEHRKVTPMPTRGRPGRSLEDVFLDLTGRQIR